MPKKKSSGGRTIKSRNEKISQRRTSVSDRGKEIGRKFKKDVLPNMIPGGTIAKAGKAAKKLRSILGPASGGKQSGKVMIQKGGKAVEVSRKEALPKGRKLGERPKATAKSGGKRAKSSQSLVKSKPKLPKMKSKSPITKQKPSTSGFSIPIKKGSKLEKSLKGKKLPTLREVQAENKKLTDALRAEQRRMKR